MKKKLLLLFLIAFIQLQCFGQSAFIKSLDRITVLAKTQPETAIKAVDSLKKSEKKLTTYKKIKINQVYAFCYYYKADFNRAKYYFNQALNESKSIKDSVFISKMWNNMGVLYFGLGKYDTALTYYDSSLQMKKNRKDNIHVGTTLMNMANVYNKEGFYITATKYYYQALQLFEQLNMKREQATTLVNIGTCQQNREEYLQADSSFSQAYRIFSTLNNSEGKLTALNNLGTVQMDKNQYQEAEKTFKRIIGLARKSKDSLSIAFAFNNLAQISIKNQQWDIARNYLTQALQIFKNYGRKDKKIETRGYLGMIIYHQGKTKEGLQLLDSTFNKLLSIKENPLAVKFGIQYATYLQESGNYKLAADIFNKVRILQKKIYNDKQARITQDMEAKYHFEKQEKEIQLSKKKQEELEMEKSLQASKFKFYIVCAAALILLFIGLIFFLFYRNKQKNKLLAQKEKANKVALSYEKFKNESLQTELKNKNKELSRFALHISEKKRFLQALGQDIKKAKTPAENKQIYVRIMQNMQSDKESQAFYEEVNQFLSELRNALNKTYNELTEKDIRLCTLIQLGLSSKDIAAIFNISPKSVDMQRYRLRKKMNIESNISIESWLERINNQ